jgi:hypothetical protein
LKLLMSDLLSEANAIVRDWKGYSAKILAYCGSLGITGRIQILFSSPERDRYFIVGGGSPCHHVFETKFLWEVEELKFEIDTKLNMIHFFDRDSKFNIYTGHLSIDTFSNVKAMAEIENKLFIDIKLPKSYSSADGIELLQKFISSKFENGELMVDEFVSYTNSLQLTLSRDVTTIKKTWFTSETHVRREYRKIIINNPRYIYHQNHHVNLRYIYHQNHHVNLKDINFEESSDGSIIISDIDRARLQIQCDNIQRVNDDTYYNYKDSLRRQNEWFGGSGVESILEIYVNTGRKRLVSLKT